MTNEDEARLLSQSSAPEAVERLREMRAEALDRGDVNLVAEINNYLTRLGFGPDVVEVIVAPEPETAVVDKPKRRAKPD